MDEDVAFANFAGGLMRSIWQWYRIAVFIRWLWVERC
jgi:hypothetical protein